MAQQAQQFVLVHGWEGELIPVRITDILGVCMVCGSADGEPCAKD